MLRRYLNWRRAQRLNKASGAPTVDPNLLSRWSAWMMNGSPSIPSRARISGSRPGCNLVYPDTLLVPDRWERPRGNDCSLPDKPPHQSQKPWKVAGYGRQSSRDGGRSFFPKKNPHHLERLFVHNGICGDTKVCHRGRRGMIGAGSWYAKAGLRIE